MEQRRLVTAQVLGDWGGVRPGDIEGEAAGMLEGVLPGLPVRPLLAGDSAVAFRGNAADLLAPCRQYYLGVGGHPIQTWNNDHNFVDEDITAVYAEYAWKGEIGGREAGVNLGVRYEQTDVEARTLQAPPTGIAWVADNDFAQVYSTDPRVNSPTRRITTTSFPTSTSMSSCWTTWWPVRPGARPSRVRITVSCSSLTLRAHLRGPTALGGIATGASGNTGLVPLESSNIDISLEVYYGEASYISIGFFNKVVEKLQ
jgi:outer membrane receptor protein involved in Fe transport